MTSCVRSRLPLALWSVLVAGCYLSHPPTGDAGLDSPDAAPDGGPPACTADHPSRWPVVDLDLGGDWDRIEVAADEQGAWIAAAPTALAPGELHLLRVELTASGQPEVVSDSPIEETFDLCQCPAWWRQCSGAAASDDGRSSVTPWPAQVIGTNGYLPAADAPVGRLFAVNADLGLLLGRTRPTPGIEWQDVPFLGGSPAPIGAAHGFGVLFLAIQIPHPEQPLRYWGRACPD